MHCFDSGPDEFVEGLARYIGPNGKFGFVDTNLKVVIPATFDFVHPFKNGRAEFCVGCSQSRVREGEYSFYEGGTWGLIDKKGNRLPGK